MPWQLGCPRVLLNKAAANGAHPEMNVPNLPNRRIRLAALAGCGILLLAAGLTFGISIDAPPEAVMLVDGNSKTYFAPPCLANPAGEGVTTLENARKLGLTPDPKCRESGGFVQTGRSPIGALLERSGLLPQLPSRWNSNGSWNW